MKLNLEKIRNFVESMEEIDFHHYISPTSYYNTDLKHSICDKSLMGVPPRELLELYFFLSKNFDEISQIVFEKLYDLEDDEVEMNGLNWYVIIYFMLGLDYKKLYDSLYSEVDANLLQLLNLNKNFNRDQYYIINDKGVESSYYCQSILQCYNYLVDTDESVDLNKLNNEKSFTGRNVTVAKGDYILYLRIEEYKERNISLRYLKKDRINKIKRIRTTNEGIITKFKLYKF